MANPTTTRTAAEIRAALAQLAAAIQRQTDAAAARLLSAAMDALERTAAELEGAAEGNFPLATKKMLADKIAE
jgi:hypothetical protein